MSVKALRLICEDREVPKSKRPELVNSKTISGGEFGLPG